MTAGYDYFFQIENWFHNGETNLLSRYKIAHFELKGKVLYGIKEGFRVLNESQHIKEVIINIPEFHLLQTTEMSPGDYSNLLYGLDHKLLSEVMDKSGILISSGTVTLPFLFHRTTKADIHLSHTYFYLSGVDKVAPDEQPIYFQSRVFETDLLDFGSETIDVPRFYSFK